MLFISIDGQNQNLIIKKTSQKFRTSTKFVIVLQVIEHRSDRNMTRRWSFYMDFLPPVVIICYECIDMALLTLFKAATLQGMNNHVFIAYAYAVGTSVLLPVTLFNRRFTIIYLCQYHKHICYICVYIYIYSLVHVWIGGEFCRITVFHWNFGKNYTLSFNKITLLPWFRQIDSDFKHTLGTYISFD